MGERCRLFVGTSTTAGVNWSVRIAMTKTNLFY
jgi:hypothetical protein